MRGACELAAKANVSRPSLCTARPHRIPFLQHQERLSLHTWVWQTRLEKPTLPSSRDSSGCAGGGQGLAPTFRRSNLSDDKTSIPPEKGGFVFWSSVLMRANSKERADGFQ